MRDQFLRQGAGHPCGSALRRCRGCRGVGGRHAAKQQQFLAHPHAVMKDLDLTGTVLGQDEQRAGTERHDLVTGGALGSRQPSCVFSQQRPNRLVMRDFVVLKSRCKTIRGQVFP